jgi:hypothetical protein
MRKLQGFIRLDQTPDEMLKDMSKRTGGIPDFAKDILKKAGFDPQVVDDADKAGRN